jgi:hypothetical protein
MEQELSDKKSLVRSYLWLRKVIGLLGTLLPFTLGFGAFLLFQDGIQGSISDYYYTHMRGVLVGTLWAIGLILLAYKGHDDADNIAGNFACIFAIGASLLPVAQESAASPAAILIGHFHIAFAALFFLTLIYFCLFLFIKSDQGNKPIGKKRTRNRLYRICGYVMAACLLLLFIHEVLPKEAKSALKAFVPVFWLETIAIQAFGISWLVKGEAIPILNDEA